LATGGGHLVYLEIGDGTLTQAKHAQLECEISCLDINPIGENPNYSQLAAVGMWTDISVRIFSLPDLNLITKEPLGGEIIPRSVLLCSFEGVCLSLSVLSGFFFFFWICSSFFVASTPCHTLGHMCKEQIS
jgi:DNA damage-binding protein 1